MIPNEYIFYNSVDNCDITFLVHLLFCIVQICIVNAML